MNHSANPCYQDSTPLDGRLSRSGSAWLTCGLLAALSLSGCATWGQPAANDPAPPQETPGMMSSLRPPGKEGQQLGLDERSREIERSLGVR
jgi:hypothetical protein